MCTLALLVRETWDTDGWHGGNECPIRRRSVCEDRQRSLMVLGCGW
jgi:hypothetical protein